MEDRYYFPRVNDFYIVRLEILKIVLREKAYSFPACTLEF